MVGCLLCCSVSRAGQCVRNEMSRVQSVTYITESQCWECGVLFVLMASDSDASLGLGCGRRLAGTQDGVARTLTFTLFLLFGLPGCLHTEMWHAWCHCSMFCAVRSNRAVELCRASCFRGFVTDWLGPDHQGICIEWSFTQWVDCSSFHQRIGNVLIHIYFA